MKPLRHWVPVCLLLPALCGAQTFRSEVHLVNVGFSVRDTAGKLQANLTQDDFEVLEDGVPQKIAFFARSMDVPLNLGLVVDISGSQASFVKSHQKDLRTFLIEVLRQEDRAFLVSFANHPRLVVNYTANVNELVNALEGYQGLRDKSPYPMLGPMEIRSGGTAFYDAIYHSANQMFQTANQGRRALVVFSDGEENTSAHHMMDAIEIAQANNVLLFCIRYTELRGRWTAKNKYGKSVMERLGRETGGGDYDAQEKDLSEHFRDIGEQLRSSYELAYHSTNSADDGTFHKVAIRVKQPNMSVRSKTGYYAK
jgi:Ca-activated chloride channel family protein